MKKEFLEVSAKFRKSKRIAVCVKDLSNSDFKESVLFLLRYFIERDKDYSLLIAGKIDKNLEKELKVAEINYSNESERVNYVISIDYGSSEIDKVTHDFDKENEKLNFHIIPTAGDFDFDNVDYRVEGNEYDLTITIGLDKFKEMGEIYEKSEYLFTDNNVVSINESKDKLGDIHFQISKRNSLRDIVYQLIKGRASSELISDMTEGFLLKNQLLEGGGDGVFWEKLCSMYKSGVDINGLIKKTYFNKSLNNLDIQRKLMSNLNIDKKSNIIWSVIKNEEISLYLEDQDNLDTTGRIIFNISKEFDIAIAVYEVEKDKLKVIIESNDVEKYSADKIARVFMGEGTDAHAETIIENIKERDFEDKFFKVLGNIYDLDVEAERS